MHMQQKSKNTQEVIITSLAFWLSCAVRGLLLLARAMAAAPSFLITFSSMERLLFSASLAAGNNRRSRCGGSVRSSPTSKPLLPSDIDLQVNFLETLYRNCKAGMYGFLSCSVRTQVNSLWFPLFMSSDSWTIVITKRLCTLVEAGTCCSPFSKKKTLNLDSLESFFFTVGIYNDICMVLHQNFIRL